MASMGRRFFLIPSKNTSQKTYKMFKMTVYKTQKRVGKYMKKGKKRQTKKPRSKRLRVFPPRRPLEEYPSDFTNQTKKIINNIIMSPKDYSETVLFLPTVQELNIQKKLKEKYLYFFVNAFFNYDGGFALLSHLEKYLIVRNGYNVRSRRFSQTMTQRLVSEGLINIKNTRYNKDPRKAGKIYHVLTSKGKKLMIEVLEALKIQPPSAILPLYKKKSDTPKFFKKEKAKSPEEMLEKHSKREGESFFKKKKRDRELTKKLETFYEMGFFQEIEKMWCKEEMKMLIKMPLQRLKEVLRRIENFLMHSKRGTKSFWGFFLKLAKSPYLTYFKYLAGELINFNCSSGIDTAQIQSQILVIEKLTGKTIKQKLLNKILSLSCCALRATWIFDSAILALKKMGKEKSKIFNFEGLLIKNSLFHREHKFQTKSEFLEFLKKNRGLVSI